MGKKQCAWWYDTKQCADWTFGDNTDYCKQHTRQRSVECGTWAARFKSYDEPEQTPDPPDIRTLIAAARGTDLCRALDAVVTLAEETLADPHSSTAEVTLSDSFLRSVHFQLEGR
jgi:hypothetical protein